MDPPYPQRPLQLHQHLTPIRRLQCSRSPPPTAPPSSCTSATLRLSVSASSHSKCLLQLPQRLPHVRRLRRSKNFPPITPPPLHLGARTYAKCLLQLSKRLPHIRRLQRSRKLLPLRLPPAAPHPPCGYILWSYSHPKCLLQLSKLLPHIRWLQRSRTPLPLRLPPSAPHHPCGYILWSHSHPKCLLQLSKRLPHIRWLQRSGTHRARGARHHPKRPRTFLSAQGRQQQACHSQHNLAQLGFCWGKELGENSPKICCKIRGPCKHMLRLAAACISVSMQTLWREESCTRHAFPHIQSCTPLQAPLYCARWQTLPPLSLHHDFPSYHPLRACPLA